MGIATQARTQLAHPRYRSDIDGLRAVAVLSVIAFHAFPGWLVGGFVGVDIFFVISGYLISTIIFKSLDQGSFDFLGFYARRIKRIFPALLLVLAFVLGLGWFALLSSEYKQLGQHVAAGAGFVSNFVLQSEVGYFDGAAQTKPLLHLWSLGIEEQFYIVWPVFLWVAWKRGYPLVALIVALAVASLYANFTGLRADPAATFYFPHVRAWELLSGGLLARFMMRTPAAAATIRVAPMVADVFSIVGLLLLAYGVTRIDRDLHARVPYALIPVAGAALIILAGEGALVNRTLLSNRVAVWFGLISYPLYLWHWPLLSFARIQYQDALDPATRTLVVALSVLFAWATYVILEARVRRGGHVRAKIAMLIALAGVLGSAGYLVYSKDGLPERAYTRRFELPASQLEHTRDLGQSPRARVMLLGDSHAAHLAHGLRTELGDLVADYSSYGCMPLYGVDRYDSRFSPGSCRKYMTATLERAAAAGRFEGVILASMGPVYLTGVSFKGWGEERVSGLVLTLDGRPELGDRWEIYRAGLRSTLDRLTKARKKVLFVFDVPELGFDPQSCFERPLPLRRERSVCAVSRAEYDARNERYKRLVYDVLKEFPDVTVYDPSADLCDERYCWAMRDGKLLYHDADHLTDEGSLLVARGMKPLLEKLYP